MLESIDTSWNNSLVDKASKPFSEEKKKKKVDNPKCNGCRNIILEKYLVSLNDTYWHKSCALCSICNSVLEESCFMLQGTKLFCRNHYYKSEFATRCAGCDSPMQTHEVAMRALNLLYHVTCFACICCKQLLKRGDEFVLCDLDLKINNSELGSAITELSESIDKKRLGLVCRLDFESGAHIQQQLKQQQLHRQKQRQNRMSSSTISPRSLTLNNSNNNNQNNNNNQRQYLNSIKRMSHPIKSPNRMGIGNENDEEMMMSYNYAEDGMESHGAPGGGIMSDNEQNDSMMIQQHGYNKFGLSNRKRLQTNSKGPLSSNYSYFSSMSHNSKLSANAASKRPRTTLSFDQKRRLMVFFKNCQNPSFKQRESLSDEMKLPPKVIQVWFQNQRAKVRQIKKLSSQIAGGELLVDTSDLGDGGSGIAMVPSMEGGNLNTVIRDERHRRLHNGRSNSYNGNIKREHSSYSSNDNPESADMEYKFNLSCDIDQRQGGCSINQSPSNHFKFRSRYNCDTGVILGPTPDMDDDDDDMEDHVYMPQGGGGATTTGVDDEVNHQHHRNNRKYTPSSLHSLSQHDSSMLSNNRGDNSCSDTENHHNHRSQHHPPHNNHHSSNSSSGGGFVSALWHDSHHVSDQMANHRNLTMNSTSHNPTYHHHTNNDDQKLLATSPSSNPFKFHA